MNSSGIVNLLKKYFSKSKNINYILEKTNTDSDQLSRIYELICLINNPEYTPAQRNTMIIKYLKDDQLLWSHPIFEIEKRKMIEENDFIICPYEISEGVLMCRKCNCRKIFSFSKQTRSIDEPVTIFARCSECGYKWSEGS